MDKKNKILKQMVPDFVDGFVKIHKSGRSEIWVRDLSGSFTAENIDHV